MRGKMAFSAQPVHQRTVIRSQLLREKADIVFLLRFYHPAYDSGEIVLRHFKLHEIGIVQIRVQIEQ